MQLIPILEIIRLDEGPFGTFGILKVQKRVTMFTLEPNDWENITNVSSIPAQQYTCKRYLSQRFGETFIVHEVPNRTGVLFHWGNWKRNTEGCILLGLGVLRDRSGISKSKEAFRLFMSMFAGHNLLHLTIKEVY